MAFAKTKAALAAETDKRLEDIKSNMESAKEQGGAERKMVHLAMSEKEKKIFKEYFAAHGSSLNSGFLACAKYVKMLEETGKVTFSDSYIMTV